MIGRCLPQHSLLLQQQQQQHLDIHHHSSIAPLCSSSNGHRAPQLGRCSGVRRRSSSSGLQLPKGPGAAGWAAGHSAGAAACLATTAVRQAATATGDGSMPAGAASASGDEAQDQPGAAASAASPNDDVLAWASKSWKQDNELPWEDQRAWRMPEEEAAFWRQHLSQLTKPTAKVVAGYLDLRYRLGISGHFGAADKQAGRSSGSGGRGKGSSSKGADGSSSSQDSGSGSGFRLASQPSGWEYIKKAKLRHPYAISLVRVGAFYEAAGIDAVLLIEHCNLSPMSGVYKAGTPDKNLDITLKQLVAAGFSVSLWEEAPTESEYGTRKDKKTRWHTQLVTPENPDYLYNYAESSADRDFDSPAIIGLSWSASGLAAYVLNTTSRTIRLHEGLSGDGVWGVIAADRSSPPIVYQHSPLDLPKHKLASAASTMHQELMDLERRFGSQAIRWHHFRHDNALQGFREAVIKSRGWPADTQLPTTQAYEGDSFPGVRPLYFSTASQLGLVATRGIPGLVDFCVPDDSPKAVRDVLSGLLVAPPPHAVAASTRSALRRLRDMDEVLPLFLATGVTTPKKLTIVLDAREGNEKFFQGLLGTLLPVIASLAPSRSPALAAVVDDAWPLLRHTLDAPHTTQEEVLAAAQAAVARIQAVVADANNVTHLFERPPSPGAAATASAAGSTDEDEGEGAAGSMDGSGSSAAAGESDFLAAANDACERLSEKVEVWAVKVNPGAIGQLADKVSDAYDALATCAEALLQAATQVVERCCGAPLKAKDRPILHVDLVNETVWLKLPSEAARAALRGKALDLHVPGFLSAGRQSLRKPYDRNGARVKNDALLTCDELDAALAQYRATTTAANAAAVKALRDLTRELSGSRQLLAAAAQLGILMTALLDHSRAARNASWALPLVGPAEQQQEQECEAAVGSSSDGSSSNDSSSAGDFSLQGLWPYWMPSSDPATVRNDVTLDGMMLLTGPNMAGKSTVLRAVAAAALLASAGLCIPAAPGSRLPLLDAVMLRTFSGDAPQEGLSAYGVEMKEMGFVLSDVRAASLVLVDELGKGTEVLSGTAIAAGILRQLAAARVRGVFATHLHLLLELLADEPHLTPYRMEVVQEDAPAASTASTSAAASAAPGNDDSSSSSSSPAPGSFYHLRPTWRIKLGHCFESLAFTVARQQGLPDPVLAAAEADYSRIVQQLGGYQGLARVLRKDRALPQPQQQPQQQQQQQGDEAAGGQAGDTSSTSSSRRSGRGAVTASRAAGASRASSKRSSQQDDVQPAQNSSNGSTAASSDSSSGSDAEDSSPPPAAVVAKRSRRVRRSSSTDRDDPGSSSAAASPSWESPASRWLQQHAPDRQRLLDLLQNQYSLDTSRLHDGSSSSTEAPPSGQVQGAWRRGAEAVAADEGAEAQQPGVVHELLGNQQPPPAHINRAVVYVVLYEDGWWYCGESLNVRQRRTGHAFRRGAKQQLAMWYVLLPSQQERRVVQGALIRSLQDAGFQLLSAHDAAMAHRK